MGRIMGGVHVKRTIHKDPPSLRWILFNVLNYYQGCTAARFGSAERAHLVAHPRQIYYFLAVELTNLSLKQIAASLGKNCHSGVWHGHRNVIRQLEHGIQEVELDVRTLQALIEYQASVYGLPKVGSYHGKWILSRGLPRVALETAA